MVRENIIQQKSFQFSLTIIESYKTLTENKEFILSKQLLRSETSIGANVEEALGAYSKKEFAAKMGIALKEARETSYWLRLLDKGTLVNQEFSKEIKQANELISILTAIIKTAQGNPIQH